MKEIRLFQRWYPIHCRCSAREFHWDFQRAKQGAEFVKIINFHGKDSKKNCPNCSTYYVLNLTNPHLWRAICRIPKAARWVLDSNEVYLLDTGAPEPLQRMIKAAKIRRI